MALFFDLLVLGGIVVVLLVLGAAAINGGAEYPVRTSARTTIGSLITTISGASI